MNCEEIKYYKDKYILNKGDEIKMEVYLRSDDKTKRCLYFLIKDRLEEIFYSGYS